MAYSPSSPSRVTSDDLNPNFFALATSGATVSQFDLYKPAALLRYFRRHAKRPTYSMKVKALGFSQPYSTPTVAHYEKSWRQNLVRFGSVVTASTGAGTNVVLRLDATNIFTNASGVKSCYPVKWDILESPVNRIQAQITNISIGANIDITLTPLVATTDLATAFVINTNYALITNAMQEGSGLPSGRIGRFYKYSNTGQIIKRSAITSGSELTNEVYFQVQSPNGGFGQGSMFLEVQTDTMEGFERDKSMALLLGKPTTSTISNADTGIGSSTTTQTTEGLVSFIEGSGYTDTYTPGTYALTDFDNLSVLMEQEWGASRTFCMWDGQLIHNEKENMLKAAFNFIATPNIYLKMGGESMKDGDTMPLEKPEDYMAYVGFQQLGKAGYEWIFATLHEFNNGQSIGASNYTYGQTSLIVPMGNYTDLTTKEGNNPIIGYRYKALNGYSRENKVGYFAGAGSEGSLGGNSVPVNQYDAAQIYHIAEIAAHHACPNLTIIQKP